MTSTAGAGRRILHPRCLPVARQQSKGSQEVLAEDHSKHAVESLPGKSRQHALQSRVAGGCNAALSAAPEQNKTLENQKSIPVVALSDESRIDMPKPDIDEIAVDTEEHEHCIACGWDFGFTISHRQCFICRTSGTGRFGLCALNILERTTQT